MEETITGDDSSAIGVILYINQEGGSWSTGDAAGLIVLASVTGAFNVDDILSNTSGATSACVPSTYSLGKDGRYKFLEKVGLISSPVFKGRIYYSLLLEFLIPATLQMILHTPSFIQIFLIMLHLETMQDV